MDWAPSSTMPRIPGKDRQLISASPQPDHSHQPVPIGSPVRVRTAQEAAYLIGPPLNAQHEHARDGQLQEGGPVVQTLPGPPCRYNRWVSSMSNFWAKATAQSKRSLYLPTWLDAVFSRGCRGTGGWPGQIGRWCWLSLNPWEDQQLWVDTVLPPLRSGLGELGSHGPLTVPSSTTGPEVTPAWGSIPYTLIALSNAPKKALGHTHTS